MKLTTLTLGLVTLATLGSATAFAAPPDVARRQTEVRGALDHFQFGLVGDRPTFTPSGRRDLVMFTNHDRAIVVEELKQAYRQKKVLPNGYRVAGWAHIAATDSYTFTMKNPNNENYIAEVWRDPQGTRVQIWGMAHEVGVQRAPRIDVPHRFSPTNVDPLVR